MLRISNGGESDHLTLTLEGQLIGPWVRELERACAAPLSQGLRLVVDLAAVSFVGREGVELLRTLQHRGVTLRNCSHLVNEQLKARATHGH